MVRAIPTGVRRVGRRLGVCLLAGGLLLLTGGCGESRQAAKQSYVVGSAAPDGRWDAASTAPATKGIDGAPMAARGGGGAPPAGAFTPLPPVAPGRPLTEAIVVDASAAVAATPAPGPKPN